MACPDDQQPDFRHFCRICKKGFMCGRALGGHMRAHGVGDETANLDDEDLTNDCEGSNKKMYALRTNPNRFSRLCENCGKEFCSWKAFLEHGKCGSDDAESSLVWSPESEADDEDDGDGFSHHGNGGGWSKRKRSFRVCQSSEDEEDVALAKCLMALSNSVVDQPLELDLNDRLCPTTNKEEQSRNPRLSQEFLTNVSKPPPPLDKAKGVMTTTTTPKGMFECKACKKVFNSHQALGGHRASHKNVKGCFAAKNEQFDDNLADKDNIIHDDLKPIVPYQSDTRKSKVHKCSICNRIFASGQALGGHKRCHWLTSNYTPDTSITKINFHEHIEQLYQRALAIPKELELKLNLPASSNPTTTTHRDLQNPTRQEVSTDINLHAWSVADQENGDRDAKEDHKHRPNNSNCDQYHINAAATMANVDDEGAGKVKLAKLSELKDMNSCNGSSSSWLQVGIGSTTDIAPDP
ncbi:hypothetical protein L2E82_45613 [Cichorium intybus]|uniref:Uncharacterized protein n=1 Tax=Cichorium intybus TaxID=13427 RepID=A0ACB8ZSI2_CICIN|nr:hypothetical protein L2E82_45613 [Cichorium intybus]